MTWLIRSASGYYAGTVGGQAGWASPRTSATVFRFAERVAARRAALRMRCVGWDVTVVRLVPRACVVRRPGVLGGTPCIGGTRVPTRAIHSMFVDGKHSIATLLREYPALSRGQIEEALRYELARGPTSRARRRS